jgi:Protein of unknown function (DUF3592)
MWPQVRGITAVKFELKPTDPFDHQVRTRMPAQFRRSGDRASKIVGGVFFVVGLGLLTGAYFSGRRQYAILKNWPKVDATVTKSEVTSGRDNDNTTMYGTEVEFHYTVSGKEYQTPATSSYKTSSYTEMKRQADIFAVGTTHALLYNPSDPNDIRYDAGYNFSFFLLPAILGGMGVIFTGVGCLVWVLFRSVGVALLCPSCNRPIEWGQEFCPHCATPLTSK